MFARPTNYIMGVLCLKSNCTFMNSKKVPGLLFTPFMDSSQFIIFTEFKSKLIKKKDLNAYVDHYCLIQLTSDLYCDKIRIGKIYKIIGPISDSKLKYEIINYYYPNLYFESSKLLIDSDQLIIIKNYIDSLQVDMNFNYDVISIDPIGCRDIDDAFSYIDENNFVIHIADVNKINHLINLNQYYDMITSVYFADKTYNMLPEELSTNLLSLIQYNIRPVISIHFRLDKIIDIRRRNVYITKNITYDEANNDINIEPIKKLVSKCADKYNKIINDSHIMVEVMMLMTNHLLGEYITINGTKALYRVFDANISTFAKYSFESDTHDLLNIKKYIHFTSPLRRTADYYNHQSLIKILGDNIYNEYHINDINKMNDTLEKIKIVSNKQKMMFICDKIVNGSIYKCLLKDKINNVYKWYIYDYDLTFYVRVNEAIKYNIEINNNYNLKLFVLANNKLYLNKIYFEL